MTISPLPKSSSPGSDGINRILDIPVEVTVELGSTQMSLRDIVSLNVGSLIELDKKTGDPVSLYVNRKLVAHGEVVVVDHNLGIKITHVIGSEEAEASAPKTSEL